jgi:uncharacterized repeat protein (TIGR03803 family)
MNYLESATLHRVGIGTFLVVLALAFGIAVMPAQAQTYKVIYNFGTQTNDPTQPHGQDVISQGRNGKLYSDAATGGANGDGAAFSITTSGKLSVVASLTSPYTGSGLTLGTDGSLYGTTEGGGTDGAGTVFKVTPSGTLTTLYNFTAGSDGGYPQANLTLGVDGNFYGTASGVNVINSVAFKITPAGAMTTLHTFTGSDGNDVIAGLIQGADGNFYGVAAKGGANSDGVVFKMSPAGTVTVLHSFDGTDGESAAFGLIQATDGDLYGTTELGGTSNDGVVFKITTGGTYTVLHSFNGTTDGNQGYSGLVQATDGNLYGVTGLGGSSSLGTIYKITTKGTFSVLYNFDNTHGANPQSYLTQGTNGILYGDTQLGGSENQGVFYSLNLKLAPFVRLISTSGKVGSKIGILGQGFSKSSVVKFGGVRATTFTLEGTTYISATVPVGAIDGKVTVTTGSTTLTSLQSFIVHNSWSSGAVLPTALQAPATGVIGGKVYVVGGATNSAIVAINQIYNPKTNTWTTGASMPTARFAAAGAVVNGILYVIGGNPNGTSQLNVVEAYDPTTDKWTTKSPMPTARDSMGAAVEGGIIYVVGGYNNTDDRLTTVESYNPVTDKWAEESPLLVGKSEPAVGLLGSTIVAAGGLTDSGVTGDNEGYSASENSWSALTDDSTPRQSGCAASISGHLYFAGGTNGTPLNLVESFSATSNKWTALLPLPEAVVFPGSADVNDLLYCFGGSNNGGVFQGTVYNYLQIYQP